MISFVAIATRQLNRIGAVFRFWVLVLECGGERVPGFGGSIARFQGLSWPHVLGVAELDGPWIFGEALEVWVSGNPVGGAEAGNFGERSIRIFDELSQVCVATDAGFIGDVQQVMVDPQMLVVALNTRFECAQVGFRRIRVMVCHPVTRVASSVVIGNDLRGPCEASGVDGAPWCMALLASCFVPGMVGF